MNCDERQDSLLEYALGTLNGPEFEELRAHLRTGCPICEGKLAEAHAMLAMLPSALSPAQPPQAARSRLMDRIQTSDNTEDNAKPPSMKIVNARRSPAFWWVPALLGAASAACVTVLVYSNLLSAEHRKVLAAQDQLSRTDLELRQVRDSAKDALEILPLIDSPAVKMANLQSQVQPGGNVRLIWDPLSHSLCLCASNLKPLPPGKGYELWVFNSPTNAIPAGTMLVDTTGSGMMKVTLPADPGKVIQVAITVEPYNDGKGMPQPSKPLSIQFLYAFQ